MNNEEMRDALAYEQEQALEERKAAINAAYEERGFLRRMRDMFVGLAKPRNSPEFKIARTEVQRLAAPALAIVLPTLAFVALMVVTSVTSRQKENIDPVILISETDPIDDPEPIPEPPDPMDVVDEPVDPNIVLEIDTPSLPSTTPAPQPALAQNDPVQPNTLQPQPSPVRIILPGIGGGFANRTNHNFATRNDLRGGDMATEGAVLAALRWMKKNQQPNGVINSGGPSTALANTSLAILTFLAHGETPTRKEFGKTVERALDFVIASHYVDAAGVPHFKNSDGNEYSFLIATYALCEAYGMTRNINAKAIAMKTLQRIVDNQSPTGGWDYRINKKSTRDDMSFAGWALQALKAGKMAGLHPMGLDECIKKAIKCLKARNFRNGGFNYTAGGGPNGLTATGCLAMQLLGYMKDKEVEESLDTMRTWLPGFEQPPKGKKLNEALPGPNPQYYCYYASQCKYQAGMCAGATKANQIAWALWNRAMKATYPKKQIIVPETIADASGKPCKMGYWQFNDLTCKVGGNTMATCLCALQLMVYYRYLPTTQTEAAKVNRPARKKTQKSRIRDEDIFVDI